MTQYGRDQDIKEHIALKSFCSLSKTLIYFIVQISKRKPISISKFPLLKERKYLRVMCSLISWSCPHVYYFIPGSPTSSLFSALHSLSRRSSVCITCQCLHQFQPPLAIVTKKSHYSLLIFVSAQLKRSSYNRLQPPSLTDFHLIIYKGSNQHNISADKNGMCFSSLSVIPYFKFVLCQAVC